MLATMFFIATYSTLRIMSPKRTSEFIALEARVGDLARTDEPTKIKGRLVGDRMHVSQNSPLLVDDLPSDAGHESRKPARQIMRDDGWKLQIVKRRQRAFNITGLTRIVERSFAWLGRNRRFSKDYEYAVQTPEAMIDIATTPIMLNRLAPA
jgi:hypothetical protein